MSSNLAREMTIFLDLDETLVHSIPDRGGNPGRRRVVRLEDGDSYWVMERPLARQMIEDCRGKDSPHFRDEWAFHLSKLKGLL